MDNPYQEVYFQKSYIHITSIQVFQFRLQGFSIFTVYFWSTYSFRRNIKRFIFRSEIGSRIRHNNICVSPTRYHITALPSVNSRPSCIHVFILLSRLHITYVSLSRIISFPNLLLFLLRPTIFCFFFPDIINHILKAEMNYGNYVVRVEERLFPGTRQRTGVVVRLLLVDRVLGPCRHFRSLVLEVSDCVIVTHCPLMGGLAG